VHRLERERFENQEVERALRQVESGVSHSSSRTSTGRWKYTDRPCRSAMGQDFIGGGQRSWWRVSSRPASKRPIIRSARAPLPAVCRCLDASEPRHLVPVSTAQWLGCCRQGGHIPYGLRDHASTAFSDWKRLNCRSGRQNAFDNSEVPLSAVAVSSSHPRRPDFARLSIVVLNTVGSRRATRPSIGIAHALRALS
jgi:hypothetical protein